MTITEFLNARLDEEAAVANAADPGPWEVGSRLGGQDSMVYIREQGDLIDTVGITYRDPVFTSQVPNKTRFRENAVHIALHDPERVLRDIEADRKLLAALEQAREYSDRMFAPEPPDGIADGEWPGERMRAATQVLALEHVVKIRAERFSGHPDYRSSWKP